VGLISDSNHAVETNFGGEKEFPREAKGEGALHDRKEIKAVARGTPKLCHDVGRGKRKEFRSSKWGGGQREILAEVTWTVGE